LPDLISTAVETLDLLKMWVVTWILHGGNAVNPYDAFAEHIGPGRIAPWIPMFVR
jgi:hypothetical protein